MADNRETGDQAPNTTADTKRDIAEENSRRDPEFEMPDLEQVERDMEQAERIFGEKRRPQRPDKAA